MNTFRVSGLNPTTQYYINQSNTFYMKIKLINQPLAIYVKEKTILFLIAAAAAAHDDHDAQFNCIINFR